ncbi:MAG: hypothetical protein EAX81_04550 [Candidatus Thorarchaeota archaeon]|nr:hypothetical protein [Candidatus Thorarchaeota archaeon]
MTFEATFASALSFIAMSILLVIYGTLDVKHREVSNKYMFTGIVASMIIVIATGRLFEQPLLHITAILVMILLSFALYRLGAIGGADIKSLLIIGVLSPGIEFAVWEDTILEGILVSGLEIILMLTLGILYWQLQGSNRPEKNVVPLIPFLLLAYLGVQLIAFL